MKIKLVSPSKVANSCSCTKAMEDGKMNMETTMIVMGSQSTTNQTMRMNIIATMESPGAIMKINMRNSTDPTPKPSKISRISRLVHLLRFWKRSERI